MALGPLLLHPSCPWCWRYSTGPLTCLCVCLQDTWKLEGPLVPPGLLQVQPSSFLSTGDRKGDCGQCASEGTKCVFWAWTQKVAFIYSTYNLQWWAELMSKPWSRARRRAGPQSSTGTQTPKCPHCLHLAQATASIPLSEVAGRPPSDHPKLELSKTGLTRPGWWPPWQRCPP